MYITNNIYKRPIKKLVILENELIEYIKMISKHDSVSFNYTLNKILKMYVNKCKELNK